MLTLDEDRHVQIPADLCRRHGWEPGQQLEAVDSGDGVVIRPAPDDPTPINREAVRVALEKLREGFVYTGPPIPVEKLGMESISYDEMYPDGE